jgi:hypothetical protein
MEFRDGPPQDRPDSIPRIDRASNPASTSHLPPPISRCKIWDNLPLSRVEIERIIAAPGIEVRLSEFTADDLETLLAFYVLLALSGSALLPTMPRAVKLQVAQAFLELVRAMMMASSYYDVPPSIPQNWAAEMFEWDKNSLTGLKSKGAQPREIDKVLYPRLLGFYELAFGLPPSHTAGGPTERFLNAFILAMFDLTKASKWVYPDGGEVPGLIADSLPRPSDPFLPPTAEALHGRIRTHKANENLALAREDLQRIISQPNSLKFEN